MKKILFLTIIMFTGARLAAQTVDCSGTLAMWAITNPWYAENCYCVSENQYPVCNFGSSGNTTDTSVSYFGFRNLDPFGPERGLPFFTLHYGDSFKNWSDEARERWRSYLYRNSIAKNTGIAVWPDNPFYKFIEWFYRLTKPFDKNKERPAGLFASLDNSGETKSSLEYQKQYVAGDLKSFEPEYISGRLASEVSQVTGNNEQSLSCTQDAQGSIAPYFGINYNSLYGGYSDTASLSIKKDKDGNFVFTDGPSKYPFKPYSAFDVKMKKAYFMPPAGTDYKLVWGKNSDKKKGFKLENSDNYIMEFSTYAASGNWMITKLIAPDKTYLEYKYGQNGLSKITDIHGRNYKLEKDEKGRTLSLENSVGKKRNFEYNDDGKLTKIKYHTGESKELRYDAKGFLSSVKNAGLALEKYTYDDKGRLLTEELEGGVNSINYFYNDASSKTILTDALGVKTVYEYENKNGGKLLTKITGPLSGISLLSYDENLNINSISDTVGRETKFVMNENSDPLLITDA
ncbi:MAG: hypothetical protein U9Q34_07645, partial [Elusimicrobiota bacterium]|nr:hypothetical protein [Elusimicrobiota bacterium]